MLENTIDQSYHYDDDFNIIKDEIEKYNTMYFNNKIITEIQKYEAFIWQNINSIIK